MKPNWLKNAIAKEDGFYSVNGEKLKNQTLTSSFIRKWNADAPQMEYSVDVSSEVLPEVFEVIFDETSVSGISIAKVAIEEPDISVNVEQKPLEKMTKAELVAYAAEKNIEVNSKDKKEDIYNTIASSNDI